MRLFVAVNFSPSVKSVLMRTIDDIKRQADSGNYTRPENLHLTLAFIGETTNILAAKEAVGDISAPPFEITIGGSGSFGDIFWAGILKSDSLSKLALQVQSALRDRGFNIEKRAFKPHITLARKLRTANPLIIDIQNTTMPVSRVSLMKSERIGGRLIYTEIFGKTLKS